MFNKIKKNNFQKRASDKAIVCGWPGSGSTFVYQAIKHLGIEVEKKHNNKINFPEILSFFTIRDPRDIVISNARRVFADNWVIDKDLAIEAAIRQFINSKHIQSLYESIHIPNNIIIRYEEYLPGNEKKFIRFVADQYIIKVSEKRLDEIYKNISIDASIKNIKKLKHFKEYDNETLLHGNHITNKGVSGAWQKYINHNNKYIFKHNFNQVMLDLGYINDDNW